MRITSRAFAQLSIAYHKEGILIMGSGCGASTAGQRPFVRQTTPHFGGTLRESSYSERNYHTPPWQKLQYPFSFFGKTA